MVPRAVDLAFAVNGDEVGQAALNGGGRTHLSLSIPLGMEIRSSQGEAVR